MAKLGDIATYINGYAFKPSDWSTEGLPIIRIQDLTGSSYKTNKYNGDYDKKYEVNNGDILISWSASLGVFVWKNDKSVLNQHIFKVIFNKKVVDKDFFVYQVENILRKAQNSVHGATMKHLTKPVFDSLDFYLPLIEEQKRIAKQLKLINLLIDHRNDQIKKLDLLVKSRFIEMFGDPYYNPKGWKSDYLGNYMTTLTDFSANGSYEILDSNVVMYDEPNYAIMVRTTDLEKGDLTGELKYIDEKAYNLLSKSKLYGGELIMSKIGSAGKIYLMPFINKPASLGRNAFMFRFNECINIVFLYTLLNTDYGTNMIQQHVRGAVTKTITKESTRKLLIYVPPIELQNQFADFVAQVDKSKLAIQQSLYELETLKKSLMQQYFG